MPHALIIDGDKDVGGGLAELVASEGFSTATATTLAEARQQLLARPPDVVLLDLVLPDGNGMDLLRDRPADSATDVIVVTGYASVESSIAALRRGATDYLLKPVTVQRLRTALSRVAKPVELRAEVDEATRNPEPSARSFQINVGDRIDTVEKRLILATVQHTQTRETAAAMLGISVKTLYNRLRLYETKSRG